ncbi:MAG: NUDIX domain-containing protein [Chitinophagaceae bacterium]|nr:NUDIX domain-containing protein [Chitinophagaceae bacterium]
MFIKIYIQNKPLYLCDAMDERLNRLLHQPDSIFIDELSNQSLNSMLREMSLPEIKAGIFFHHDFNVLKKAFFKKFEIIKAGGGLVENELHEILMIFRQKFWDLPKGKLDEGETIEECATREIMEETGIKTLEIIEPLIITYHTYEQGTHHILKESHWFLMKASVNENLIAQKEEDISDIKWIGLDIISEYLAKSYPSIKDVIEWHLNKKND